MRSRKFKATTVATVVILAGIISLSAAIMQQYYTIHSKGSIRDGPTQIRPLHVEGSGIYNDRGEKVHLHGVCFNSFTDSATGWFPGGAFNTWDEAAVRQNLEVLQSWGCNFMATQHFWNWLAYNKNDSTEGVGMTDIGNLDAVKRLIALAYEYGIYVGVGIWALYPPDQTTDELAIWVAANQAEFVSRWLYISQELRVYPNVFYGHPAEVSLYPESEMDAYFDGVVAAVQAIRADGDEHIFLYHEDYCEYPIRFNEATGEAYRKLHEYATNIVYGGHIYRWHGTFGDNPDIYVPTSKSSNCDGVWRVQDIKDVLTLWGYRKILDGYQVPIIMWEGGPANYPGAISPPNTYQKEMDCNRNWLSVLNEWDIGYAAFWWREPDTTGNVFLGLLQTLFTPTEWGQALIDSIMLP